MILTLGLVVPLVSVGFYNLSSTWQVSRRQLDASVEQQAELAATAFEQWIEAQKQPLFTIKELTEDNQSSLVLKDYLNSIVKTRPNWQDVQIVSANGQVKLSQSFKDRPLPQISIETLRREVEEKNSLVILTEQISEERLHLLSLALPLMDGDFVVARIDGAGASQVFEQLQLPEEHIIAVFDDNNRLLYRSHVSPEQLFQDVSNTSFHSALKDKKKAIIEVESPFDNIQRVYGLARLKAANSFVVIGVPSSTLYEPARNQFLRQSVFSLLITLLGISLAFIIARSITEPLRHLQKAAQDFGEGDLTARADIEKGEIIREVGTAFNQMADQIAEREEKLKELDKLKSEFVSSVSHELRTPLTTIKTLTRVLQRSKLTPDERNEYLKTIAFECDRQIDFVQNLLDLSRIESGAYKISLKETNISELLENCFNANKAAAKARQIKLKFIEPDEKLPNAMTDATALKRIVSGLLENAVKYTPEGGEIILSAETNKKQIFINVKDNGCGIAADDQLHIFEKFFRGRRLIEGNSEDQAVFSNEENEFAENESPGVGLGLYVVKSLVEQIGGEIKVESPIKNDHCGTLFTVLIPFV